MKSIWPHRTKLRNSSSNRFASTSAIRPTEAHEACARRRTRISRTTRPPNKLSVCFVDFVSVVLTNRPAKKRQHLNHASHQTQHVSLSYSHPILRDCVYKSTENPRLLATYRELLPFNHFSVCPVVQQNNQTYRITLLVQLTSSLTTETRNSTSRSVIGKESPKFSTPGRTVRPTA